MPEETNPTSDHDMLIVVASDVAHLRSDVAQLTKALKEETAGRELRLRKVENNQGILFTRWRVFGWIAGTIAALGGIVALVSALT